jgi:hypothetical protein
MIFLTFTAVDLGEEIDYAERFVLYCPYTGNNLLETGWEYPPELLYLENNLVGEPEFVSEEIEVIYQRYLDASDDEEFEYSYFLDYLADQESENSGMMKWDIVHPDGSFGDFISVVYRNDMSY